jgi:hypothetical protein
MSIHDGLFRGRLRRIAAIFAAAAVACGAGYASHKSVSASVPTHISTLAYLGTQDGAHLASFSEAAPWVDWALTNLKKAAEVHAAGIHTLWYTNPNRVAPNEPTKMWADDESLFAHDCSGNRIAVKHSRLNKFLTDPTSATLRANWRRAAQTARNHGFDAIFDDTADDPVHDLSAQPCRFDQDDWSRKNIDLVSSVGFPVIYNGLNDVKRPNGSVGISEESRLNQATSTIGGMAEGCYITFTRDPRQGGAEWIAIENTELLQARVHKLFICMARAKPRLTASDPDTIQYRQYAYASLMLTYDPSTTVLTEPFFDTPSTLNVMPEVKLVPTRPLKAAPSDVAALRESSGVYAREYAECYIAGSPIGPCAAVVNPDKDATHAFPFGNYHHTVALSGSGILDGGVVDPNGPPPGALAPLSGVIATR